MHNLKYVSMPHISELNNCVQLWPSFTARVGSAVLTVYTLLFVIIFYGGNLKLINCV